jgi:hypothetical protein
MVSLHANYIKGNANKALRMNEHGFWLALPLDSSLSTAEALSRKKMKWSNKCKPFAVIPAPLKSP